MSDQKPPIQNGLPKEEKIRQALARLDIKNVKHWMPDNKPNIVALRFLAGDQSITEEEVEAVSPGFARTSIDNTKENGDATPPSDGDAGAASPETQQASEEQPSEEDLLARLERARRILARARAEKEEADRDFAQAQAAVDKLIELTEKQVENANGFSTVMAQYQAAQQKARDSRAGKIHELRGVNVQQVLKDVLPGAASQLDAAFARRKPARSAPGRTN